MSITVYNPPPGGGESSPVTFRILARRTSDVVALDLPARDLVYDSTRGVLYASLGSGAGALANRVAVLDPATGSVIGSVAVGGEPNVIALSTDAAWLYVGLDADSAVRRVRLASLTPDIVFPLGSIAQCGPLRVLDMVAIPGVPSSVAIARRCPPGLSPPPGGIVVYDDGAPRPAVVAAQEGIFRIEPGATPSRLYAASSGLIPSHLFRLTLDQSGVAAADTAIPNFTGGQITFQAGRLYATGGGSGGNAAVFDPESGTLLGTIDTGGGVLVPDEANRKIFRVVDSPELRALDATTFQRIEAIPLPDAAVSKLVRWGPNGIAYTTGTRIILFTSPLVTN